MKIRSASLAVMAGAAIASSAATAHAYTGSLSTPAASGMVSGGNWSVSNGGFEIAWDVNQNPDGTWNYHYTLSRVAGAQLTPGASHAVFQLSSNITSEEIFNFGGNYGEAEFGTFGPHPSNPGFPTGLSIFGIKIDFAGSGVTTISFDSTRQPMWGDFYAKGGATSFVYNTDLGVPVANANDYWATPVDANNNPLFKILVPDTIPAPGSIALVALGGLMISRRRRS